MFAPERTMRVSGGAAGPMRISMASVREHIPALLIVCVVGGGLMAFFLGVYAIHHYVLPIGFDTPRYLFQTNLVADRGLSGLPHALPPPVRTLASRAGFPVVTLGLSSILASTPFQLAAIVPPVAAASAALASGAFVSWTLRRSSWEWAAVAVVVGTSSVVIRLLAPETYSDNLIAAAMFAAAMVPLVETVRDGRGFAGAALLLGVGGLAHFTFFAVMLAVLAVAFIAYAPASWRAARGGHAPFLSTPSARIGAVAAGAGALTAAAIAGLLHTGPDSVKLTSDELREKLHDDVPLYRFPLTLPLAAIGVASLALPQRGDGHVQGVDMADRRTSDRATRRLVLTLLGGWTLVVSAGVVAFLVGFDSPAHRFLAFLLPLPILVGLGILAVGRLAAARGTRLRSEFAGRALGVGVVAVAVAGLSLLGARTLYDDLPRERGVEWLTMDKVRDAATASAWLDAAAVPDDAPVVFVIDDVGPKPEFLVPELMYMIRAVLPADRLEHAYVYVGDPEQLVAGRPTMWTSRHLSTRDGYDQTSIRFWPAIRDLLPRGPVALVLHAFDQAYYSGFAQSHPDRVVAPNVALVLGSKADVHVAAAPPPKGPNGIVMGGAFGIGALVVLSLVGIGWVLALLPGDLRPFEALALAPAMGLGMMLLAGILVDAAGIRLSGLGGVLAGAIPALGGWWAGGRTRRRSAAGGGQATTGSDGPAAGAQG